MHGGSSYRITLHYRTSTANSSEDNWKRFRSALTDHGTCDRLFTSLNYSYLLTYLLNMPRTGTATAVHDSCPSRDCKAQLVTMQATPVASVRSGKMIAARAINLTWRYLSARALSRASYRFSSLAHLFSLGTATDTIQPVIVMLCGTHHAVHPTVVYWAAVASPLSFSTETDQQLSALAMANTLCHRAALCSKSFAAYYRVLSSNEVDLLRCST